jgi:hypothetical protein
MTDDERESQSKSQRRMPGWSGAAPDPEPDPEQGKAVNSSTPAATSFGALRPDALAEPASPADGAAAPVDVIGPAGAVDSSAGDPVAPASAVPVSDEEEPEDEELPEDLAEDEASPALIDRLRTASPALVTLAVLSIGSALFLIYAMTSHTTPVGVLMSSAIVTGIVFGLDAFFLGRSTVDSAMAEETGRALLLAMLFGVCAVGCALAFGGLAVLVLTLGI